MSSTSISGEKNLTDPRFCKTTKGLICWTRWEECEGNGESADGFVEVEFFIGSDKLTLASSPISISELTIATKKEISSLLSEALKYAEQQEEKEKARHKEQMQAIRDEVEEWKQRASM